jgi:hypothetical protein
MGYRQKEAISEYWLESTTSSDCDTMLLMVEIKIQANFLLSEKRNMGENN